MGIGLGLVSLYFAAGIYGKTVFLTYFTIRWLPFLNILPVVLLVFLLYLLSNRVWISFLISSVLTFLFSWINYFKLMFRNDPFMSPDMSLFSESANIVQKYDLRLDWKMVVVLLACAAGTVGAVFLAKQRIRRIWLRAIGLILLVGIGWYSYGHFYTSADLYNAKTQNFSKLNRWSATQVYISKGFVYPFLYSIKSTKEEIPEGYDKAEAEKKLLAYGYFDIPAEKKVSIITIQLEAFNDFSKFKQLQFNQDVYGPLHQLEAESYYGELVTNMFAGGTDVTERGVITGYTTRDNFRENVNSYARYFAEQGYTVDGSHPSYDWFYNRKNVNLYLGFPNYYYFENMYSELAKGQIARDGILMPQIIKLYEANKASGKPFFSFNVTYQNHGPYSAKKYSEVDFVKNLGYSEGNFNILNNYFMGVNNTIKNMTGFVDYFRTDPGPVVLIFYGDHNPWMGDNKSVYTALDVDFDRGTETGFFNYYCTPYVIWGNESAKKVLGNTLVGKGPRIGPNFLMDEVFKLAGYQGNEFMKASADLMSTVDVVHATNRYKENGVLTDKLTPADEQKLEEYYRLQYYWKHNLQSGPMK